MNHSYNDSLAGNTARFRLLELDAASSIDSPLVCHLTTYDYNEHPSYEALSYVWGVDPAHRTIRLNNSRRSLIRPNLEQALRYLRLTSTSRTLWIDAICINQEDDDEKSNQLPLMRDIFSGATQVLIWLGGPNEAVESAFSYMLSDSVGIDPDDHEFVNVLPGLLQIFQNSWWKRMWTAQELIVAHVPPILVCGHAELSWTYLDNMISYLDAVSTNSITFEVDMQPVETISVLRQHWRMQQQEQKENSLDLLTLGNLLMSTSDRQAHDPKDQVFALLGIASTDPRTNITGSYRDSISSIYQKAMVEVLLSRRNLEFLRFACLPQSSNGHELPSWCLDFSVPDWNAHREGFPTFSLRSRGWDDRTNRFEGYDFGRALEVYHFSGLGAIKVLGAKIGTISGSWMSKAEDTRPICLQAILEDVQKLEMNIMETLSVRIGRERASRFVEKGIVWQTLDGGPVRFREVEAWRQLQRAGFENTDQLEYYELLRLWTQQYLSSPPESKDNDGPNLRASNNAQKLSTFGNEVSKTLFSQISALIHRRVGKAVFFTESGLVGRIDTSIDEPPADDQDILCILQKCTRAVVLRPCNDGRYQILTFAYVQDIFEESDTAIQSSRYEEEWFEIC